MMNNFNNNETNNNSNNNFEGGFIMTTGTILSVKDFAEVVKVAMEAHFGQDYRVTVQSVNKNNDVTLVGISILSKGTNIAPTIYVDGFFEDYQAGRSMESIFRQIINIYETHKVDMDFDVNMITEFENVRNRICVKLINAGRNEKLLAEAPHVIVAGDLAAVFFILVSMDANETGSITVKNNLQDMWDVDTDTLYDIAIANSQRLLRGRVQSMATVMTEILETKMDEENCKEFYDMMVDAEDFVPLYVCSNANKLNGASVILYDGILSDFANRVGGSFYILPSSVHETLFIADAEGMDVEHLKEMVRSVNETEVSDQEYLSDNVFYYNCLTDRLELA